MAPKDAIMNPSWLIVEYARTPLISGVYNANVAPTNAVRTPTNATVGNHIGKENANGPRIKISRAIKYMPAFTIVAACNNALTEVGASIALYNQVCKGSCADLAMAPPNVRKATAVSTGKGIVAMLSIAYLNENEPK